MQNTPDDADRRVDGFDDAAAPHPSQRTAAAGREFLKALAGDLSVAAAAIRARLAHWRAHRLAHSGADRRQPRTPQPTRPARTTAPPPARRSWAGSSWRVARRLVLSLLVVVGVVGLVLSGAMLWALRGVPIDGPPNQPTKSTLLLEAANGQPLGRAGPLRFADVPLKAFPKVLINAVLSIEDRRFYQHIGVDPWGVLRAIHANRAAGEIVQGGSTITQQLVKMEYLNDNRTYRRKLREALLAVWLEARLGRDQILDRYLNRVYLGDGAFGMQAAARLYFDKRPQQLTLPEAAMLAGLIQAPSEYDPLHHLEAARTRAATVLDAMVANHVINAAAAATAKAHPASVKLSRQLAPAGSWFAGWAAQQAAGLAGAQQGSVRVRTTLDPRLQHLAQRILDNVLATEGRRRGVSQGALVAMRPDGAVLAMVGGRDYRKSQFNRATDNNRQPGSAFKLFVYLAALRAGYTPQDLVDGGPIDVNGWQPQNYDNEQFGELTLAQAFAHSVNTAAVRLEMKVGVDKVIAAARDLGITEKLPHVPSLALGSAGISLLDLTGAFASVREDRLHVQPWGVGAIGPADGSRLWAARRPLLSSQTLDPYRQPLVDMLHGVVAYGTGRNAALGDGSAAGKTGTSQDYRDAWFLGFNDTLVVGVWVGNDNDAPMKRVTGGTLPAEIWKRFVAAATPLVNQPETVAATGEPGSPDQPDLSMEGSSAPAAGGSCDIAACSARYRSFRAGDCTYQPYGGGPRRLCPIAPAASSGSQSASMMAPVGTPLPPPSQQALPLSQNQSAAAPRQCNIPVCEQFYSSFDPATCTYQPYGGGPRQLCER